MAEMNPQRKLFKEYYCNPTSDTFNLIYESALKAGFSKSYSKVLMSDSTGNDWVKRIIKNYKLKNKAERVLEEMLDMPTEVTVEKEDITYVKIDTGLVKVKQDSAKFILDRLGKDDGYTTRTELTGKDGVDLIPNEEARKQADKAINDFINDNPENTQ